MERNKKADRRARQPSSLWSAAATSRNTDKSRETHCNLNLYMWLRVEIWHCQHVLLVFSYPELELTCRSHFLVIEPTFDIELKATRTTGVIGPRSVKRERERGS